jgi:hypothetical protein
MQALGQMRILDELTEQSRTASRLVVFGVHPGFSPRAHVRVSTCSYSE